VGKKIILGIRPEDFEDASIETDAPPDRRLKVTADLTEPLGSEVLVHFRTEATGVVSSAATADVGEDAEVRLAQDEDTEASTRLVARVSPKSRIAVGSEIELAVDTARLYFFNPETRAAI
jgi:multiple sugar transport system ATP-binding protein